MEIRKIFKAEIAHRLTSAYSKRCLGLHGHSYIFEIFIKNNKLDKNEMIIDFGKLKAKVNNFMDAFDHSLLINKKDIFLVKNAKKLNKRYIVVNYNPTAEQISQHIFNYITDLKLKICKVIVHETKTGYAVCKKYRKDKKYKIVYSKHLKIKK